MLFEELCGDVWHVYTLGLEYETPARELAAKLTGMHRAVTVMRDCGALTPEEGNIVRQFIRDCREEARCRYDN